MPACNLQLTPPSYETPPPVLTSLIAALSVLLVHTSPRVQASSRARFTQLYDLVSCGALGNDVRSFLGGARVRTLERAGLLFFQELRRLSKDLLLLLSAYQKLPLHCQTLEVTGVLDLMVVRYDM